MNDLILKALEEASRALTELDPLAEQNDAALLDEAIKAARLGKRELILIKDYNYVEGVFDAPEAELRQCIKDASNAWYDDDTGDYEKVLRVLRIDPKAARCIESDGLESDGLDAQFDWWSRWHCVRALAAHRGLKQLTVKMISDL